ncbi:GNAT family N-acetyltransferase [Naasia sp. SYSU D00948]|uniref:GNAT family N-acetyltransferase n=1 Tax=Naasia sp. SYSU D00948 TaxID=2817379 RepID=UPI001B301500|nr:GNAT family N-acetyltransferase [Naasia sp. SYSU D00948]
MAPFELRTERLLLDQPVAADVDDITRYCQDPLFERFMTVPVPYSRRDAEYFVSRHVPDGWASGTEYTWALRVAGSQDVVGMIALRTARPDLGYWLGAPHRGHGYMTEAVRAVTGWAFRSGYERVEWECVAGNLASAAVARGAGFGYTGEGPSVLTFRDGSHPHSWHGVLPAPDGEPRPWPGP